MSTSGIRSRKLDHIDLALQARGAGGVDPGWSAIRLSPVALPGINPGDVDLSVGFLGHRLHAPIIIAGMTGGHEQTTPINANLAIAAEECGVAMGVGSQRAALQDAALVPSYAVVREHAPKTFICGNIGISQLVGAPMQTDGISRLIDMVQADAIAVHINVLQELVQPEGSIDLSRALPALEDFISRCPVPVIVKETGCGLDEITARRLKNAGAAALDVGGAGGTSFVQIEGVRAARRGDAQKSRLSQTFAGWGLASVPSLLQVRKVDLPLIATGGIRNGLDVARALALRADLVGIGSQMLAAALKGPDQAIAELRTIIDELTIAMVLTDSADVAAMRQVRFELDPIR
jgi:isopentenyl-diphosphate Delta-isomerase